jgi:hypothetical protein
MASLVANQCLGALGDVHPIRLNGLAHPSGNVICSGDEPGYDNGCFDEAAMCVGSSRASP